MKMRLRGSSLRLRLTQREVAKLAEHGRVDEVVKFGPDTRLTYALTCGDAYRARFAGGAVEVVVPTADVKEWAESDRVSLEASQAIGDGDVLHILVEKDWACVKPRTGEDESDAFPHPTGHC